MDPISTGIASKSHSRLKVPFAKKSFTFGERINLSAVEPKVEVEVKSFYRSFASWFTGSSVDAREASNATKTVAEAVHAYTDDGVLYTDHNSIANHAFENKDSPEKIQDFMKSAIIWENWSAMNTIVKHANGPSCQVAFKNIVSNMLDEKQQSITACASHKDGISIFSSVIGIASDQQLREYFKSHSLVGRLGGTARGIEILNDAVNSLAYYDPPVLASLLAKLGPECLNAMSRDYYSLLYHTLNKLNLHLRFVEVKLLLKAGLDPNWKSPPTNTTALHNLCQKLEPDRDHAWQKAQIDCLLNMTEMFIQAGANINARDENGMTPLHKAILALCQSNVTIDTSQDEHRYQEPLRFIRYLLDQGACTYQKDNKDWDALKYATDYAWVSFTRYSKMGLPEIKAMIIEHREQVESFRDEVRKTKNYPFIEHVRGNRPLSAGFIKSAIVGTVLEDRADWRDYIIYELLNGKPFKQGDQHPNYSNNLEIIKSTKTPVKYENLQDIAKYYQ